MKLRLKGISVEISFYFVAVITLMIIVFPQSKGLFCFFFCIFHELGHLAAMMIFGKKIYSFYFGYFGIKIVTGGKLLPTGEEIIVAFAGPAVNIILALIFFRLKQNELAYINISLAVFNLLPVQILDGGRILALFMRPDFPIKKIGVAVSIVVLVAGIIAAVRTKNNFSLIFVSVYLLTTNFY